MPGTGSGSQHEGERRSNTATPENSGSNGTVRTGVRTRGGLIALYPDYLTDTFPAEIAGPAFIETISEEIPGSWTLLDHVCSHRFKQEISISLTCGEANKNNIWAGDRTTDREVRVPIRHQGVR